MGKKTVKYLLPLIHFISSFFYEREFLIFNDKEPVRLAIPRIVGVISDNAEHVLAYVISKLFAAIFIFLLWQLIFYVGTHLKKRSVRVALGLFLVLFVVFGVFLLPDYGLRSADNYITYMYARTLWPEYWHSAYLSMIYTGCMMVFPNPGMITFMQWVGLSFVVGYAFERVESSPVLKGKLKWVLFALFFIPNSLYLCCDPYRTEVYAIICMFFVTVLVMDAVDGVKRSELQMVLLAVLAGFIAVFRSEGIILGVGGYMAMLIYGYKLNRKRVVAFSAAAVMAFVVISIPQKLGDKKYYGKDYSIINSFPSLVNILNSGEHNIDYDGAEESLAAIDAVVPLDLVRVYGMEGYRRYNYFCHRPDINQSCATDEQAAAYVKGFHDLVLHNPVIYLKTQFVMWEQSLLLRRYPYVEQAQNVTLPGYYTAYEFPIWNTGATYYSVYLGLESWRGSQFRMKTASGIMRAIHWEREWLMNKLYLSSLVLIAITLFAVVAMFRECVLFFKKKRENTAIGVFLLILLLQYAAIVMVMPAGMTVYFHATYYGMFITEVIYIAKLIMGKKEEKAV